MKWVSVSLTEKPFDYWGNRPYVSDELRHQITGANLLLVPREYLEEETPVFPSGTASFFKYLNSEAKRNGLEAEVCISDEDYQELAEHFDLLVIAGVVVTVAIAPIATGIIANYIYDIFGKRRLENGKVKATMLIEIEGDRKTFELDYDGPAKEYKNTMLETIEALKSNRSVETHNDE